MSNFARLFAAAALLCAARASPAAAQTSPGSIAHALGVSNGQVWIAPYAFTPVAPGQYGLALTTATALAPPSAAIYATVCAAGASLNYTLDGVTTPTVSLGQLLTQNSCVFLSGAASIKAFSAISTGGGTLNVSYFQ